MLEEYSKLKFHGCKTDIAKVEAVSRYEATAVNQ
jgi:hypothetical protein